MSTMVRPSAAVYHPSLSSLSFEQGALPAELSNRTSTLETDKLSWIARWRSPVFLSAAKDSFLAFCSEILQFNDNEDEEDRIAQFARDSALIIAERAFTKLPNKWRKPRVASDGGGGVRLTWKAGDKELRAVIPADSSRMRYLYIEQGEKHSMIRNFTPATLCDQFDWLLSNTR